MFLKHKVVPTNNQSILIHHQLDILVSISLALDFGQISMKMAYIIMKFNSADNQASNYYNIHNDQTKTHETTTKNNHPSIQSFEIGNSHWTHKNNDETFIISHCSFMRETGSHCFAIKCH